MQPSRRSAYLAWVAVCLLWGTTYLAIRIALETIPPMSMAAFRWIVAGSVLIVALKLRGERLPSPRTYGPLGILGILLLGFGNGGVVWAERYVPSGLTAVLVATTPFWMVGIDALMPHGEPIAMRRGVGLAIGFTGIVMLVWPEIHTGGGRGFLSGVMAAQLACLGWAIGSTYARTRAHEESVLMAAAYEMLFGGLFLLALGLLRHEWSALVFSSRSASALVYLIVFGAIAGFSAYAYALKHLPVATVSLYAYVNPVIAVALGTLVLGEPFSWRMVAAAGVVFVGIALVRARE